MSDYRDIIGPAEIAKRARVAFDAFAAATERLRKAATQGTRKRGPRRSYREFISEQEMRQMAAGSELCNLLKLLDDLRTEPQSSGNALLEAAKPVRAMLRGEIAVMESAEREAVLSRFFDAIDAAENAAEKNASAEHSAMIARAHRIADTCAALASRG